MKFIVAAFGIRYAGMLLTNVESIARSNPTASVEVYWQDLPTALIDQLKLAYPSVTFVSTDFDFSGDALQRISSKTLMWELAGCRQSPGEHLAFIDVDTIVLKELAGFFSDQAFDVAFTWKHEQFVLNTGVLLALSGDRLSGFLSAWRLRTQQILQSPVLFALANSPRHPYGGADQMALHQILDYTQGTTRYRPTIDGFGVDFVGFPCKVLNETNSVPIDSDTHIIHYKGGWQPILLDGAPFTRNRSRHDCHEMYSLYLQTFDRGLARLNRCAQGTWTPSELGIAVPIFSKFAPGPGRDVAYALHVLPWLPSLAVRRARTAAYRALKAAQAVTGR